MTLWSSLRLSASVILFLVGLLSICRPPSYSFWKLSIVVMEGGHFLVLPLLTFGALSLVGSGRWAGVFFILAAGLYGTTAVRALSAAAFLQKEFEAEWGRVTAPLGKLRRSVPVSVLDMYTGIEIPTSDFKTFVYKQDGDLDLKLDFYPGAIPIGSGQADTVTSRPLPENGRLVPCVVVVHGGGWDGGARSQLSDLNGFLAAEGYAVATLQYRLAPKHQYPAPVEDVKDAMAWLRSHAFELAIDTTRFVLLGRSAGGQIALQSAYTLHDPSIKGVIAFYAPADMVFGYSLPTNPLIMDSRQLMVQYLGGSYPAVPGNYLASSPVEHLSDSSPPTLLLHGRPDVLVSWQHTVHMRPKMEALGMRHFVVDVPWGAHGFEYVFRGPGSQISLYFIERFLAEVVR
ncbi:MAG: alpha/beta hydrolase [Fibrobacteria bacterium]